MYKIIKDLLQDMKKEDALILTKAFVAYLAQITVTILIIYILVNSLT